MPATPIDEQESNDHQRSAYHTKVSRGHENELLEPGLELPGEGKVRQAFKKAEQSDDRKEIPH
jgi:hypothetical protein